VITGGRIFVTGDLEDRLQILALDLEGRTLWKATNGAAWKGSYPGARACCAVRDGRLFHMNAHGRVTCLNPATGQELWSVSLFDRFGGKNLTWALSECLLVDGPRLIVTPGGTKALVAALDVRDGATVWSSEPLRLGASLSPAHERVSDPAGETDSASYASPILLELGGRRLLASCSLRHAFGLDADTGRLLWTRPLPTRHSVIAAMPVLVGDALFVTAPDAGGGKLYRLRPDNTGLGIERLWSTSLDTCHGGVVHVDGRLYGSWYRSQKGWACVDAQTGEVRYETKDLAMGSVLYADGRLYCLSQEGEMALLRPREDRFEFVGRFPLVSQRTSDAWAHPVIHKGRLYLRDHDKFFCYGIRAN
jgi:outer membrane protein assembly factor BamB